MSITQGCPKSGSPNWHWQMLLGIEIYHRVSQLPIGPTGVIYVTEKRQKPEAGTCREVRCAKRLRCRGTSKIWPNQARISLHCSNWLQATEMLQSPAKQAVSAVRNFCALMLGYIWYILTECNKFWCLVGHRTENSIVLANFCHDQIRN